MDFGIIGINLAHASKRVLGKTSTVANKTPFTMYKCWQDSKLFIVLVGICPGTEAITSFTVDSHYSCKTSATNQRTLHLEVGKHQKTEYYT